MLKKWWILFITIALFLLIRVSLPHAILYYANNTLKDIPHYSGKIKDIDLHLLAGKYSLQNIELVWLKGKDWVQIVNIPSIEIKTVWSKLFQGKLVAYVNVNKPELTIYNRMLKPTRQKAKGKPLTEVFNELSPAKIELLTIKDAKIRFRNYFTTPNYVLYADSIYVTLSNLTNMQKLSDPNYAQMDMKAKVLGSGDANLHLLFNPIQTPPNFFIAFKITGLDVNSLDTFSKAYGGFDFEKGTMDLFTEITQKNKKIDGYVKPIFKNIEVFSWQKDVKEKKKSALKAFWEGIVGATSEVFENQQHNQLATKIPISGTVEDPNIDIYASVVNVLRGAFVKAFVPTFEGTVKPPYKK